MIGGRNTCVFNNMRTWMTEESTLLLLTFIIGISIYLPALRGVHKQGYLGLYKALGACLKRKLAKIVCKQLLDKKVNHGNLCLLSKNHEDLHLVSSPSMRLCYVTAQLYPLNAHAHIID